MNAPEELQSEEYGPLCDAAIEAADPKEIERLRDELGKREQSQPSAKARSFFHYCLGNLYSSWSRIDGETSTGWRAEAFPLKRSSAIDHFRKSLKLDLDHAFSWADEAQTNLGNELAHQHRGIEAFTFWKPDFSRAGDSPFVSALNRSRELIWTSRWLNDPSHACLFQYEAYFLLKELQKRLESTDHPLVRAAMNKNAQIRDLLKHGDSNFETLKNWQTEGENPVRSDKEAAYREWCLRHRLFANPIAILTNQWVASQDILQFPNHVVKTGEGPYLPAAFSSLKREYCFARFLAYEGLKGIHSEYENESLFLTDTLDYVLLDGATEKLKTSLRVCFGVFDSLAFVLNRYFQCGANHIQFSSRWIKENLKGIDNPFIDALYWLACDLTDTTSIAATKWKAPEAELSEIRKLRNAIEHGWLRVAQESLSVWTVESDFAQTITPSDLRRIVLLTLRVTNSALLYLTLAVKYHEEQNKPASGLVLPTLTPLIENPGEIAEFFGGRHDEEQ